MKTFFLILFSTLILYSTQATAQTNFDCSPLTIHNMQIEKIGSSLQFSYYIAGCDIISGYTIVSTGGKIHFQGEVVGDTEISILINPSPNDATPKNGNSGPGLEASGNEYIFTINCEVSNEFGSDFDGCDIILDGDGD